MVTIVDIDHGHNEQFAVLVNNSVWYEGNQYDHGREDFGVEHTRAKMENPKAKVVHIDNLEDISPGHRKVLSNWNSDWSFDEDED